MTPDQLEQIQKTIKETVNGKIDAMSFKLDQYIVTDNAWKVLAQPAIDLGNNVRGFGKVTAYFIGFLAGIAGIFATVFEVIRRVK